MKNVVTTLMFLFYAFIFIINHVQASELPLPASKVDLFINSPYIMLVIIIIVILVAAIYRKLRYG